MPAIEAEPKARPEPIHVRGEMIDGLFTGLADGAAGLDPIYAEFYG